MNNTESRSGQIEFKRAEKADIDKIVENRMNFIKALGVPSERFEQNTYTYLKKHIDDGSFVAWLAMHEDNIVSIAVMCIYNLLPTITNLSGKTGCLFNVFTHEEYRRKGLAAELVKRVISDAKTMGVGKICLHATNDGKYVYDKLGFEELSMEMALIIQNEET